MSVTVEASSISYNGNDIADEFSVPFKFLETGDLLVRTTDDDGDTYTTLVEDVDYTVDGEGDDDGGTVTTTDPVATGDSIVIERNTDITQESDFAPQGAFPVARHETALDKLTLICQELARRVEALEALESLLEITGFEAVQVVLEFTTDTPIEDTFPFQVTAIGGDLAIGASLRVILEADPAQTFDTTPTVQWFAGPGDKITVTGIDGLDPAQDYQLIGVVFVTS